MSGLVKHIHSGHLVIYLELTTSINRWIWIYQKFTLLALTEFPNIFDL